MLHRCSPFHQILSMYSMIVARHTTSVPIESPAWKFTSFSPGLNFIHSPQRSEHAIRIIDTIPNIIRLLEEAYAFFKSNYPLDSMHTVSCFVELLDYLLESNWCGNIDIDEFEELLQKQIDYVLTHDTSVWSTEYVCKPSLFINSPKSIFYTMNKDICDFECEFISNTQETDGSWHITWEWGSYPEQWYISKNWWKSDLIIKNVKFYNAIHR